MAGKKTVTVVSTQPKKKSRYSKQTNKRLYQYGNAMKAFASGDARDGVKSIVNFGRALPLRAIVKHRYVETVAMTSTAGSFAYHNWCINGMYDPNITSTGHQPFAFDTFSGLYDHYIILGSRITCEVIGTESNATPARVGMYINDDSVLSVSTIDAAAEQTLARVQTLGSGGDSKVLCSLNYSAPKRYGVGYQNMDNLQGTSAANPTERTNATLVYQSADMISSTSAQCTVTIEYIALWREPKDIAQS